MYIIVTENMKAVNNARMDGDQVIDLNHFDVVISKRTVKNSQSENSETFIKNTIAELLISLGIPTHLKGFNYLIYAIQLALAATTPPITKYVYPTIAKRFKTSASSAERNIRSAIGYVYTNTSSNMVNTIFGNAISKNHITNNAFICGIATYLQKEYNF